MTDEQTKYEKILASTEGSRNDIRKLREEEQQLISEVSTLSAKVSANRQRQKAQLTMLSSLLFLEHEVNIKADSLKAVNFTDPAKFDNKTFVEAIIKDYK